MPGTARFLLSPGAITFSLVGIARQAFRFGQARMRATREKVNPNQLSAFGFLPVHKTCLDGRTLVRIICGVHMYLKGRI